MIRKLLRSSPLKYQIVRWANCLVSKHMVNQKEVCVLKFSKIVDNIYANNQLSSKEADDANIQLDKFLDETAKRNQEEFL